MRSLILAGGNFPAFNWLRSIYRHSDLVVAADRGGLLALQAAIPIDILVGDFDSLPESCHPEALHAAELHRFPCDKDYSDTELALRFAREKGCKEALIVGALGGRFDHSLFNAIAILELADQLGIQAALVAPEYGVKQLAPGQQWELSTFQGWHCSLIALDAEVTVSMQGLLYSGTSLRLKRASTRGLSNAVQTPDALVSAEHGRLLVVLSAPDVTPTQ